MQQSAFLVVKFNHGYEFLFNCMMVGQTSEKETELSCMVVVFGLDDLGSML